MRSRDIAPKFSTPFMQEDSRGRVLSLCYISAGLQVSATAIESNI